MIKTFVKNLKYLFKYSIKEIYMNSKNINSFYNFEERLYAINSPLVYYPKIKTIEDTIQELIDSNKSIIRFDDDEFIIIQKQDLLFQRYNEELESRLREMLISQDDNVAISIPSIYFNISNKNYTDKVVEFLNNHNGKTRKSILNTIDLNKTYYSSESTNLYNVYVNYDFANYFNNFKKIWNKKDIVVVGEETIFSNIDYNIFDNTNSFTHYKIPSKNAFDSYEAILNNIVNTIPKTTLIITILGPTATVLAYDLYKVGYRALNLGNISRDYDDFMKKNKM